MKKLMLFLVLFVGTVSNAQDKVCVTQYQALTQSEYASLKSHSIDYVCPLGRNTSLNDKKYFDLLTPGGKKLLKSDVEKFKKWNSSYFSLDPNNSDTLMMSSNFHDRTYIPWNVPITGYYKHEINNGNIEYIEIVEYKIFYPGLETHDQLMYNFIILIKYKNEQLTKFIPAGYFEDDCGQCQVY